MKNLSALLSGLLFGMGLALGGMTSPVAVLGFLNFGGIMGGTWNPALAFVMGGALITTYIGYRLVLKRKAPLCNPKFDIPTATAIDKPLLTGAALFGIGWGLAGYCPGPALASLTAATPQLLVFLAMFALGAFLTKR